MTPEEWDKLADQVLTRGIQKTAEEFLNTKELTPEELSTGVTRSPPGFSDETRVEEEDMTGSKVRRSKRSNKNQRPKRLGSPIKRK